MTADIGLIHFSRAELACRDSGGLLLAPGFGQWIDEIREQWGKPLKVTSCCRSMIYNRRIKGATDSYHIYDHPDRLFGTCAIDLAIDNGVDRRAFIAMLLEKFWDASIGVNRKFIHVDRRTHYDGSQPLLFTY